jgi:hypothetical protein
MQSLVSSSGGGGNRKRFANWQKRTRDCAGKGGRGRRARRSDLRHVGPKGFVELASRRLSLLGGKRFTHKVFFAIGVLNECMLLDRMLSGFDMGGKLLRAVSGAP